MSSVRESLSHNSLAADLILRVIDERIKRVTPRAQAIGATQTVFADEVSGGQQAELVAGTTTRIEVPNNGSSTAFVFGARTSYGTVFIDYAGYRDTKFWSGTMTIQHFGASDTDSGDSVGAGDATIKVRDIIASGGGDALDSNNLPHILWTATINDPDIELVLTATDDTNPVVMYLSYKGLEEHE